MNKMITFAAVTLTTLGFAASASAKSDTELLGLSKLSLTDAVAAAEKNQAGKAVEADLKEHDDKPVWAVKILNGDKEYDVKVDGTTGGIIESKKD